MGLFLLTFSSFYILSQWVILFLLFRARTTLTKRAADAPPLSQYPGVSILTSLKGPTPGAVESVLSLLNQDYPGPLELILAAKDENEPLISEIKAALREDLLPDRAVRWVYPVPVEKVNPRTAKIARAFYKAQYDWIFMVCVDTRFDLQFLSEAMRVSEANAKCYVTSFPVIDHPQNLPARLEAVGLNVDVSQFFLLSSLSPQPACAYGGAFLFHRQLLLDVGGFEPFIPLLTDDVTLARAFTNAGGLCRITGKLAYVRQERHTYSSFWSRQVRWRMIARYFLPELFVLSPLSWVPLYLGVAAAFSGAQSFIWVLGAVVLTRVGVGVGTQMLLVPSWREWRHGWILPLYDALMIPAWIVALIKRTVSWGPTLMKLNKAGAVTETIALKG